MKILWKYEFFEHVRWSKYLNVLWPPMNFELFFGEDILFNDFVAKIPICWYLNKMKLFRTIFYIFAFMDLAIIVRKGVGKA